MQANFNETPHSTPFNTSIEISQSILFVTAIVQSVTESHETTVSIPISALHM
jgi:hypothetical protein